MRSISPDLDDGSKTFRFLLLAATSGLLPLSVSTASKAGDVCGALGSAGQGAAGSLSLNASSLSPSTTLCTTAKLETTVSSGTVAPDGKLNFYAPIFFSTASLAGRVHSINFIGTTITGSPTPGTAFLEAFQYPGTDDLGATRINLINASIGTNRAITLVEQSGDTQFQNVYIASTGPGALSYDALTIENPALLAVGEYNIAGQDFSAPTDLTLKDSTVSNARLVGVRDGSSLALDNTTIDTQLFRLDGTLTGNGTINGKSGGSDTIFVTASGASLSPGNSIGTLTINGDLRLNGATSLLTELDPTATPNADLVDVSGAVTGAQNLTITLEKDAGYSGSGATEIADFSGATYVVLDASSIDSDAVTLVEGSSLNAHLSASLVGSPSATSQVEVQFTDNSPTPAFLSSKVKTLQGGKSVSSGTPWAALTSAISATHHGTAVNGAAGGSGGGGQTLAGGSTLSQAFLSLTNANLVQLNQVHAEPYSSNLTVSLEQLDHVASTVMNRIAGSHDVLDKAQRVVDGQGRAIWLDVSGVMGHVDGKDGLGTFDYQLANVIAGADILASPHGSLGAFAGYGYQHMGEHDNVDQTFSAHSGYGGLYATLLLDNWQFAASGGYGYSANSGARNNPDVGLFTGGEADADFSSNAVFVAAKAGYSVSAIDGITLTPFVASSYAHVWQGEARESGGGDFNYDVHAATADAFMTGAGLDWVLEIVNVDPARAQIVGFARYDHDWSASRNSAHEVTVTSDLFGTFTQTGQNRGAHSLSGGLGLAGSFSDRASWRLGIAGAAHEHGEEAGAGAHFSLTF
jgi:uncharacterized protein with beta-barrel porin domain